MQCRAIPYEGNEPYIFLSYCHKDSALVYPLFTQMVMDGYRVWYDDGNIAGDDWPENIANHLNKSCVCLAFISNNSSNSHNCNTEVTFAIKQQKKLLPVMLEDFSLPLGLSMLLSSVHYIQKKDFSTDHALLQKIYQTSDLEKCKTEPGSLKLREIPSDASSTTCVSNPSDIEPLISTLTISLNSENDAGSDQQNSHTEEIPVTPPVQPAKGLKATIRKIKVSPKKSNQKTDEKKDDKSAEEPIVKKTLKQQPITPIIPSETPNRQISSQPEFSEETIIDTPTFCDDNTVIEDQTVVDDATLRPDQMPVQPALLLHPHNQKHYVLRDMLTKIGRTAAQCDVVIDAGTISKHHADIILDGDECFLIDNGSSNGTFYNGNALSNGERIRLSNPAVFQLHNESLVFIGGGLANHALNQGHVVLLLNPSRTSACILEDHSLALNRNNVWPDNTLNDPKIHRANHAVIHHRSDGIFLEDVAPPNGNRTYLNESSLSHGESRKLRHGDHIRLGNTTLEVVIIEF